MDIEKLIDFLERVKEFFFETLCSTVIYWILFISMVTAGYFATMSIKLLPKPETFMEFLSFLFKNPNNFYSALGLSFLSLLLFLLVGITTMFYGFKLKEIHSIFPALGLIVGTTIIVLGIYFLGYFIRLLGPIVLVVVLVIALFSSKD